MKNLKSLDRNIFINVKQYNLLKNACCVQEKNEKKILLIASINTRKQKKKMCKILLKQIR